MESERLPGLCGAMGPALGLVHRGMAWRGVAWRGMAWRGVAWRRWYVIGEERSHNEEQRVEFEGECADARQAISVSRLQKILFHCTQ